MRLLLIALYIILQSFLLKGQGCSDAGACSIQTFDFEDNLSSSQRKISLSFDQNVALGEKFIFISQSTLGVQYSISSNTRIEIRIPFIFTYGNLGYTSGIGDMILSVSQDFFRDKKFQISGVIGGRLKTNNSNFSFDNQPLPMAYQTSLGTYDIILGSQYTRVKWNLYIAYQHPFGRNESEYLVPEYETNPDKQYFESAYLKRGDDLYLRAQYNISLKKYNSIKFNLLTIYRIQKSDIIKNNENIILESSNGLTVNPGIIYSKQLKNNRELSFLFAFPIIDRAYRADGLTRNIVFGLRINNL